MAKEIFVLCPDRDHKAYGDGGFGLVAIKALQSWEDVLAWASDCDCIVEEVRSVNSIGGPKRPFMWLICPPEDSPILAKDPSCWVWVQKIWLE
jgi:hypothetical protein